METKKRNLAIALVGLMCISTGCSQTDSGQSAILPVGPTTTLPVDLYPSTDIYFASDIDPMTRDRVRITVAAAEEIWGQVPNLEIWVTGLDTAAALTLRDEFCAIRIETKTESSDCEFKADKNVYEFSKFALESQKAAKSTEEFGPTAYFRRFSTSGGYIVLPYPNGLATRWPVPAELDQITIFHEYLHAVQERVRNIPKPKLTKEDVSMTGWMLEAYEMLLKGEQDEPRWLSEGLAVFLSEYYVPRLRLEGKLDRASDRGANDPNELPSIWGFMRDKWREIQELKKEDPTLTLENSGDSTFARAPYMFGAWAIQYLKQEKGMDVFLNEFYPAIRDLGWEAAFKQAFGRTVDQFYREFDQFLNQSDDEIIIYLFEDQIYG
jgi:hypothetical protein